MHARSRLAFLVLSSLGLVAARAIAACSDDAVSSPAADAGNDASVLDAKTADAASADARSDGASCKLVKPYSTKDKTCNTCAETECCAEVNGCLGDTVCDDDYVNCILACVLLEDDAGADADAGPDAGIPACEKRCGAQSPKGETEYVAATACVDTRCKSDCK
jgi:hypothetical protein